jgi:hypothetical protein
MKFFPFCSVGFVTSVFGGCALPGVSSPGGGMSPNWANAGAAVMASIIAATDNKKARVA